MSLYRKGLRLLLPSFVCFFALPALVWSKEYPIKVLLTESAQEVELKSYSSFELFGANLGEPVQTLQLRYKGQGKIAIGKDWIAKSPFYAYSKEGVYFKGHVYDGLFEIYASERGLKVVNSIPIENYLVGVVCSESNPSWPIEALKAQSVLSRTYAMRKLLENKEKIWQIGSDVIDQVYKGKTNNSLSCQRAVKETTGLVLTYGGQVIQAFYHANSGGYTEDPKDLWKSKLGFLDSRSIPYGKSDPSYYWQYNLTKNELAASLRRAGYRIEFVEKLWVEELTPSGRASKIGIAGNRTIYLSGENFRAALGYGKVKSTKLKIYGQQNGFVLAGEGNGHGVGYCQWCGKEMAAEGQNFENIIQNFYQKVEFRKLY